MKNIYTFDVHFEVDTEFCEPFKIRVFATNQVNAVFNASLIFCNCEHFRKYDGFVRSVSSVNLVHGGLIL